MNTGMTQTTVYAIVIDPTTPSTLYAGTYSGVWKTTNGGANWSEVGFFATYGFVIDPTNPSTLYAATDDQGVWKTTNGGRNWTWLKTGLTLAFVHTLAIDPSTPTTLYAGTYGDGVFQSTNGGASWQPVNTGLPQPPLPVNTLALAPTSPTTIYTGIAVRGVFRYSPGPTVGGDFNGDGKTVLLWQNQATGAVIVWYMNGPTMLDALYL